MKIIRSLSLSPGVLDFHPDSTLLLPGRPLFYPAVGESWVAVPHIAVRICRLGKRVSPKFASRYYDAISPAIHMELPCASPDMEGILSGMDSTITHGSWFDPLTALSLNVIKLDGNEIPLSALSISTIDNMIAHISRFTTIRMGDILLIPLPSPAPVTLCKRTRLIATAPDGSELMNVKIV